MKRFIPFILFIQLLPVLASAQGSRYLVEFRHKGGTTFTLNDPSAYLSPCAIERRTRYQIPIDSVDLPVPASWISTIRTIPNVTILNVSRWINAVSIQTTDPSAIATINSLWFVKSSSSLAAKNTGQVKKTEEEFPFQSTGKGQDTQDYFEYGSASYNEISIHNGQFLHNIGLRGQGMQVAVLDGGFYQYTTLRAFDSMNLNGQVLDTWDFVDHQSSVVEDNAHGMQCLSTIAANIPGEFIGKAPKASFYLYRTEDVNSEYPIEEFNWACGAERADSSGADLLSSSLGYGYGFSGGFPDYPYSDLNGDITISARAADIAASRGLLVLIAAGNSGNDYWKMILTPADGDSVLAVGAVNTAGNVASFSSYGPSADGRVKPDIASVGWAALLQGTANITITGNGTSFACPNMAGLATCLWQGFPEVNNMRIFRALRESGSRAGNPDTRMGYGIPDVKEAFSTLLKEYATTSVNENNCRAELNWSSKDVSGMFYLVERKTALDAGYTIVNTVYAKTGETLSANAYDLGDDLKGLPAGTISYRITQVLDTSSSSFTALQLGETLLLNHGISCGPDNETGVIVVAPNPTSSSVATIIFNSPSVINRINISVFDMKGVLVLQATGAKPAGLYRKELNISRLAAGKYLVRIMDGDKKLVTLDLLKLK